MERKTMVSISAAAFAACVICAACSVPQPGTVRGSILVGQMNRTYLLHWPPAFTAQAGLPLVIALHPFTGTGSTMERMTGFSRLADRECFLVAYPNGRQRVWNADPAAPSSILGPLANDVAFLSALIDDLIETYGADPDRVFVKGASSGGLMTQRVAGELTGKLAAAASVMVTLPVRWDEYVEPSRPLPFLMIHGVDDPFFPWEGGVVNEGPFRQAQYKSAEESVAFWVRHNQAVRPPLEISLPDRDPTDGTTVFERTYAGSPGGAEVVFYGINGGGHTWPGSRETALRFLVGRTSQDIKATKAIWDFFKTHARRQTEE